MKYFRLLLILFLLAAIPHVAWADEIIRVPAEELAAAVAAAQPGDTIEVTGGVFNGNLVIDKPLTLIGIDNPILDANFFGTVVMVTAPDTTVRGFTLRNSGNKLITEDAGVNVGAPGALIEDNILEDVLFGLYLHSSPNSTLRNNHITGKDLDIARRGDLIRIWESNDVLIEGNVTINGRDAVLWYSQRLTLRNNEFTHGRYGLHFMYDDDAIIEGNRLTHNSVGAYLMYSRRTVVKDNLLAFNRGPSGYGIGLKDVDDASLIGNRILDNRVGAFLDASPRELNSVGIIQGNLFAYNDIAIEMLPSVRHNMISDNSFVENEQQVVVAGGGQLRDNEWTVRDRGNYWSDYAGYDADGDGRGEVSYQAQRLLDNLLGSRPELRLFLYSPVVNAVDFASRAFPIVRPQPILVDDAPLTQPLPPAGAPLPIVGNEGALWPVLLLPLVLLFLYAFMRLGQRRYHMPASPALMGREELGHGD
ncbi:MAG TPA: nitrous oxide reductase family maturation protein NosD [Promineifilum sp.]|nr:nitrous oxide reductase family maturation protein NosD [Promineifilum sp.]HRO90536.1 nitrous oxide reductase family maturation protein NosD [Promineifilum sp.]HRQ12509.1 nitrous oxide reductase family maturation protein NosD [Promineifilum sp.]